MQINHHLLLKLWDQAVNRPGYIKEQWMELSDQINTANMILRRVENISVGESAEDRYNARIKAKTVN